MGSLSPTAIKFHINGGVRGGGSTCDRNELSLSNLGLGCQVFSLSITWHPKIRKIGKFLSHLYPSLGHLW